MMKQLFFKTIPVFSFMLLPVQDYAQGLQRYTNSLFAEYGFVQYNNNSREWLGDNSNLLSFGLGYHKNVAGFLGLGLKVKHYETVRPEGNIFNSNAIQFQVRLQRPRISRTFRLRRFNPYLEAGFGYANEYRNKDADQFSAEYTYAALAAGIDYSFSDHWSLGVQGEYRLSGKDVSTVVEQWRNSLNPFNTASVRLNFYFGRNRQRPAVPRIYTRQATTLPTDSMYRGAANTAPVHRDTHKLLSVPVAAGATLYPQANTVTIKDSAFMRIVNADAVKSKIDTTNVLLSEPAIRHVQNPRDTTVLLKKYTITNQRAAIVVKGATMDTARAIAQQGTMIQTDTTALIAKIVSLQEKDTTIQEQPIARSEIDTLMVTDTSTRSRPENDTTVVKPGSEQPLARPDTVLRTIRDTVTLYRRDTVTVLQRDTVVQQKRDTVIVEKTAAKIMPEKGATIISHVDSVRSNVPPGDAAKRISTESGNKESAAQTRMRTGNSTVDESADQQLEQRLKQIEAENAVLQNRLRESENRSSNPVPVQNPPARPPVLTPASTGKNNTNLVVLPVGLGSGKKEKTKSSDKEQRLMVNRQDSMLNQLSLIQTRLEQLQRQQLDTLTGLNDSVQQVDTNGMPGLSSDTLSRLHTGKIRTDSVQQAMAQQIRQLSKENEALQQMIGTVSGMTLENDSSAQPKPVEHDVFFNVNQYKPDTLVLQQLQAFSGTLRSSGAYWILLEGFTDKSGNAAYNLQLSRKRVAAVKAVLIEKGIPKEHILEKTFGSRFSTGLTNSHDRKVRITQILR
ncbi:MAG TPA: OmpA family protein [Chitinophagaceae bacterium]|nr:OmpA family protein [Chitinophagaceae bacterium]